jgi:Fe-S cluster assembly protein SufD
VASLSPAKSAASVAKSATGTLIEIPEGAQLDEPIVLEYDLDDASVVPSTRVVAGAGARATILERVHGGASGTSVALTCDVEAGARADITYTVLQTAATGANLEVTRRSDVGADARMTWNVALLGGAKAVDSVVSRHTASGASTDIAALFFPVARENVQLTTEVRHDVPSTASTTVVRSIAAGHGRGRYFGNIRIAPHAHGSEASLRDDTLLIGKDAKIDAIPALEIAANDVKAFHGATVGAIDDEHIFYLMSRGIERGAAEKLIALGFFEPALARFPGEAFREEIRTLLAAKLAGATP